MANYARELPLDKMGNPYTTATPNIKAWQAWQGVPVSSSTIGLTPNTTAVQLAAVGGAINFSWGPSSVTSTNFDGTIVPNATQTIVVPISYVNQTNLSNIVGANIANGLYNSISVKCATGQSSSVFGTEF